MDIRRMFTYDYNSNLENDPCPTNEIWYTSSNGKIVTPSKTAEFGANIVSNNYINGQGIISFDGPVTAIGEIAFYNISRLTSVTIPDSVTTFKSAAFAYCKFASITIPDSVISIEDVAFTGCNSLTSVTIGDGVTTIGDNAFSYCSSLTSIYCKATTPPVLSGTSVFDSNGSGRKIYVPAGSVEAYKSATNWSEYASAIVGYSF